MAEFGAGSGVAAGGGTGGGAGGGAGITMAAGPQTDDDELSDLDAALPDLDLRFRVAGAEMPDDAFRQQGRRSLADLSRGLRVVGRQLGDYSRILDFGCGCGRVTRHFAQLVRDTPGLHIHGCDIDADAIRWDQQHLQFATFVRNEWLPPLPFPDGYFDLIVNHSVFTHLPEDYQDAWLAELRRVTAPNGIALLTVSGLHAFAGLVRSYLDWPADPAELQRVFRTHGLLYIADDSWVGSSFPDFYHSTFHNPHYVLEHWGQFFTVEGYLPRGALQHQDLVVLRRGPD